MKKRSNSIQDSLDLFLDAICNTFGGIVLISIVAAILLQMASRQSASEAPEYTPGQIEQLKLTLSQLESQAATQTSTLRVLEGIVAERFNDPQTQALVRDLQSIEAVRDNKLEGKAETLDDLADRTADLESKSAERDALAASVRQARAALAAAEKGLKAEQDARTKTIPLPKAIESSPFVVEVAVILKGGRYYELHVYSPDGDRSGLNTEEFVVVETGRLATHVIAKPYAGTPVADNPTSRAAIRSRLSRFRGQYVRVCFVVRTDSFAEFDVARSEAVALGLPYRVMPTDDGVVDRGGSNKKSQ